jgi:hypothetical protein
MTDNADDARPPVDAEALALAEAPEYPEKTNILLAIVTIALVVAPPLAVLMGLKYGWIITYLLPWPFYLLLGYRWNAIDTRRCETFYVGIQEKYDLSTVQFENVWRKKSPISTLSGAFIILSAVYLVAIYSINFFNDKDIAGFHGNGTAFHSFRVFIFIVSLLSALVLSLMPMYASKDDTKAPQSPRLHMEPSLLQLQERDRNDIEIIGIEVELAMLSKRVEAYTLESTLLSALAFSAFITIQYSEKSIEALSDLSPPKTCANLTSGGAIEACLGSAMSTMETHTMVLTCLWLLACSVSFLAVLVARLRFNEAHRYNDEIIKIAQKLNDRENATSSTEVDLLKALTAEIANLLARARIGMNYLIPMISFIKTFRDIGVLCFIMAISTCGLHFGIWPMILILSVFLFAYLFGHGDRIRHEIGFMPQLKSTIMNVIQHAR